MRFRLPQMLLALSLPLLCWTLAGCGGGAAGTSNATADNSGTTSTDTPPAMPGDAHSGGHGDAHGGGHGDAHGGGHGDAHSGGHGDAHGDAHGGGHDAHGAPGGHDELYAATDGHGEGTLPGGHNEGVLPDGHSESTPPSGHDEVAPPGGHAEGTLPDGHNEGLLPGGHNEGTPPTGHNEGTLPGGHNEGVLPDGHSESTPPSGHGEGALPGVPGVPGVPMPAGHGEGEVAPGLVEGSGGAVPGGVLPGGELDPNGGGAAKSDLPEVDKDSAEWPAVELIRRVRAGQTDSIAELLYPGQRRGLIGRLASERTREKAVTELQSLFSEIIPLSASRDDLDHIFIVLNSQASAQLEFTVRRTKDGFRVYNVSSQDIKESDLKRMLQFRGRGGGGGGQGNSGAY